ncbi:MAG: endolytic transglycosylase MltG [Bacteroidales bacterium]|nr:endolytic transglycosylase MltG [Bacteroidales bacterium]
MKKKILIVLLCLLLLGVAAIGAVAYMLFASNTRIQESTRLLVPQQTTMEQLQTQLHEQQILRDEKTFQWTCQLMRFKTPRTGKYTIEPNTSNIKLVRQLRRGQHFPVNFTFNNLRTVDQLIAKTDGKFFFEKEELAALLQDTAFIQQYGFTPYTLPSAFIPNSYQIYYDITAKEFFEKMYGEYQKFWTEQRRALAEEIGLTPAEVSTLASIVEEENRRPAEKSIIAGLYMNRLHMDMLLQSDPTVKFALGDFTRQRILNADLQVDSPYNTYKYRGLPPGPIRIPEASTLDSVLHYRHHDYLYMCAKEDFSGYHNFTASPAVHAQNAARYRAALNKRNIKR